MARTCQYSIGIDVGKESLVVQVMQPPGEGKFFKTESTSWPNHRTGYRKMFSWLKQQGITGWESRMVMEATGLYWKRAAQFFYEKGFEIWVINPRQMHSYMKGYGTQGKTDRSDARIIAHYGHHGKGHPWVPDSTGIGELRSLIRHREDVLKLLGQLRNRKESWAQDPQGASEVKSSLECLIKGLSKQRTQLDKAIHQRLVETSSWKEMVDILHTVPGLGDISIAWLLVETKGFQRFPNPHALASYAGVVPHPYQSGTSVKRKDHISNTCQRSLRSVLYMAGLCAIRVNPLLKEFYLRLRQRQKPFKVALIAVIHKLLRILFALVRNHQPFCPNLSPITQGGTP